MKRKTENEYNKVKRYRAVNQESSKGVRTMSSFFWGVRRSGNILVSERNVQIGTMPYKKTR